MIAESIVPSLLPLAWLFSVLGPMLLIGSGYLLQRTRRILGEATRHQAVVVDRGTAGQHSATPPTVQWTDPNGFIIRKTLNVAISNPKGWYPKPESGFETGQKLWIYDHPDFPREAILDSTFGVWGGALASLVAGVGITAGGWFLMVN